MQHGVPISEIKNRAEAVGTTLRKLAIDAGVSPATAYRGAKGSHDSRVSTVNKLLTQLEILERARLTALAGRYGEERAA